MDQENKYHCHDCGNHFGNIPALGCPCCHSDNYYPAEVMATIKANEPELITT